MTVKSTRPPRVVLTSHQRDVWRRLYTEWQTDGLIDIDLGHLVPRPGESREECAHRYAVERFVEHAGPWQCKGARNRDDLVRAVDWADKS